MLKLGLETESLHLWLQHKRMDIFGFIEKAHKGEVRAHQRMGDYAAL